MRKEKEIIHIVLILSLIDDYVTLKYNTSLAALGALAHGLQRRTACKIQNGRQGAPKWRTGSGKVKDKTASYQYLVAEV